MAVVLAFWCFSTDCESRPDGRAIYKTAIQIWKQPDGDGITRVASVGTWSTAAGLLKPPVFGPRSFATSFMSRCIDIDSYLRAFAQGGMADLTEVHINGIWISLTVLRKLKDLVIYILD